MKSNANESKDKYDSSLEAVKMKVRRELRYNQPDFWLLIAIVLLLGLGTMMVASASSAAAYSMGENSTAYDIIKKQIFFAVAGLVLMFFVSYIDYKLWAKLTIPFFATCIVMLVLVELVGSSVNGAKRWLDLGFVEFQPSELLKIGAILLMAYLFSRPKLAGKITGFKGVLYYGLPIGAGVALLALQPHISCVLIIGAVVFSLMIAGGVKFKVYAVLIIAVLGLGLIVYFSGIIDFTYIIDRVFAFRDPEKDTSGDSYQIMQSLYAIASGGLFGKGFGQGVQKYLYLPEPYNDFILSILAEEMGFIGVAIVLGLFALFVWRGFLVARNAPDKFSSLTAFGITTLISVQVLMNVAVVTSSMPVTGISLPFFSYGGTSLVILLGCMGILLNISKQAQYDKF